MDEDTRQMEARLSQLRLTPQPDLASPSRLPGTTHDFEVSLVQIAVLCCMAMRSDAAHYIQLPASTASHILYHPEPATNKAVATVRMRSVIGAQLLLTIHWLLHL